MIDFALELEIDGIQAVEPGIPGNFIFALPPNAFLLIESWLVRRKVLKMNPRMALEEELDCFAFVPASAIHIKMDGIAWECSEHMLQDLQESLSVTPGRAYQSFPSQQWRHPTGQIEPPIAPIGSRCWLVVGTLSGLPFLSQPRRRRAGMAVATAARASLILKDEGFIGFHLGEFFSSSRKPSASLARA